MNTNDIRTMLTTNTSGLEIKSEPIHLGNINFCQPYFFYSPSNEERRGLIDKIDRYIINENATIIFWKSGDKTISRVDPEDKFDKEIGFMLAVYKYIRLYEDKYSKNELKKDLQCIKDSKLYDYLFIMFNKHTFEDTLKSRRYLEELVVDTKTKKKNNIENKKVEHIEVI